MDTQPGPGADSAAPPPAPDFSTFEAEANARDLGKSPASGAHDAAPPADQPGDQAASTDARPADSASAPPPDKKPKNLQTRAEQLDREVSDLQEKLKLRKALRDELATLDQHPQPAQPASDPARTQPKSWERYKALPDAPKVEDFEAYEDYLDARSEFIADKRYEDRERRASLDRESQARVQSETQKITKFTEKVSKAREADPDFDSKVHPDLMTKITPAFALPPGAPIQAANVLLQEIVDSDASTALLVHFSTPEGLKQWNELVAAETPAAMIRAFGRIEARFLSDGSTAAAPAPAKPVTSAPAPPTTLGKNPPQSPDRAAAALKASDFGAYQQAADAADLAVARR